MAQDTLLGFPAHTLPYRRGAFTTLSISLKRDRFKTVPLLHVVRLDVWRHVTARSALTERQVYAYYFR